MSTVAATPTFNNYSPELRALLDKHMPKEGEPLIFRQIYEEQKRQALAEGDVPVQFMGSPRGHRMLRTESIIDPGTGRPITIANLKGFSTGEQGQQVPTIDEIVFSSSGANQIFVSEDDPILAERLLLSNKNRDCINTRKRVPENGYTFEMLKPAVSAESDYDREMKVATAMATVRGLQSEDGEIGDDLRNIVEKLSIPTLDRGRKLTQKELLGRLVALAKVNPETIENAVRAGEAKLEQLISKAEKLGLLDFVEEGQEWRWKATQAPITQAVQGYKPQEALVRYIQSNANGINFSQMLAKAVKLEEKKPKA